MKNWVYSQKGKILMSKKGVIERGIYMIRKEPKNIDYQKTVNT